MGGINLQIAYGTLGGLKCCPGAFYIGCSCCDGLGATALLKQTELAVGYIQLTGSIITGQLDLLQIF